MGSDDQVIVLGGDDLAPPDPVGRRRPPLPFLLLVAALFVGLVAFVLTPQAEAPTAVDPAGLEAPPEPPRAYVVTTASTVLPTVPEIAIGWKAAGLVGGGWISDIAHGEGVWVAVADNVPVTVHTSANGVLWEARSLAEITGFNPQVAVGPGMVVVAASTSGAGEVGAVGTAVSVDGGETWVETTLDRRPNLVSGVSIAGRGEYVFGRVLEEVDDPFSGAGRPVVWRRTEVGWSPVEDPAAGRGAVTGVVEGHDGSVRAFGDLDGAAASWVVGARTLEPVSISVPAPQRPFLEVSADGSGGFRAVSGDTATGLGNAVWRSEDLTSWETEGSGMAVSDLATVRDEVFAISDAVESRLVRIESEGATAIANRYPGVETGWEDLYITAIATDGATMVIAGVDGMGRPTLAMRGSTLRPVSLPAVVEASTGRWKSVASADTGLPERSFIGSLVTVGDEAFVASQGVWRIEDLGTSSPAISLSLEQAWAVWSTGSGIWATGDGTQLHSYGDGAWVNVSVPFPVETVADVGGGLLITGSGPNGLQAARSTADGSWVLSDGFDPPVYDSVAVQGGLLGWRHGLVGPGTLVVSTDGLTWQEIEGELGGGWSGDVPFLIQTGAPGMVRLLDRWPEVEDVHLPTKRPLSVRRFGDELWVQAPGALWVGSEEGTWDMFPIGVQHGVDGLPAVIPGDVPTLVVAEPGRLRLLRFEE